MQSLSKQLPAAAATHLLLLNMSGKGPGGLWSTRGTGSGPRGHLWAGGSGGDDSGFGHPLAACGSGCRQNSLFCPQRSPLPPSWAGLQQRGRSRRVPCELRDLSLFLYKQGTVLQPALLLSPTQTLFLVRGDLLGTSPS